MSLVPAVRPPYTIYIIYTIYTTFTVLYYYIYSLQYMSI